MPGCSAIGCNNRSERGYVMKCFPRDPKLRQLWKERVNRADWEPSNNSFLCHMHFERSQWMITENGKVRLKKDAVPSVFKINKYKRSHKKALKPQIDDDCEYNFIREQSEGDVGQLSPTSGTLEDKDSDSQDIDPLHLFLYPQENKSLKMTEDTQASHKQSTDTTSDLQQEDTIVISDDEIDVETKDNIKECHTEKQADNEKSADNQNVKLECDLKNESIAIDSYDEIEEKLKQICDGDRDESVPKKQNTICNDQKEDSVTKVSFYGNVDSKYSSSTEVNDTLTNDTENVETIFGSESGEECGRVSNGTSRSNNTTNEIDKSDNVINNKDGEKIPEDPEKSSYNGNSHVASHEKIAVKRKISLEEILSPVKKSNQSVLPRDTSSMSSKDISDNTVGANNEMEADASLYVESKENSTGVMLQLPSTPKFTIKEHTDVHQENSDALVTSVIMLNDEQIEANVRAEHNYEALQNIASVSNSQMPSHSSPLNDGSTSPRFDEETNDISSECPTPDINSMLEQPMVDHTIKYEYRRLQQKVKIQEDVIKELTTQLIMYKDMEKDLRNKKYMMDLKLNKLRNLLSAYDGTEGGSNVTGDKKTVSLRKRVFEDLSFTATYVEEANKRLRERLSLETEKKKQLECQVKQKDAKLKELNWKLEKASKYLERSEKNTNKYKRKMLNMQSFLKRRKLMEQEISKLGILMLDNRKGQCSKETLEMAIEIKTLCGEKGYEKLRSFGFPFPASSALRTSLKELSEPNKSDKEISQDISMIERDALHITNHKLESDVNVDLTENTGRKKIIQTSEIIMGTVQDIFEECNGMDDFSFTDEIKEEFILQLDSNLITK